MGYGKAFLLAAALGGVGMPAVAQTAGAGVTAPLEVPPIRYTERTLPNGLRVLALRETTTPNVAVSVWYEVGSKHDPEGRSGFAHLFEHILSRKTVNMPYNMINKLTEDVGGSRNASTWYDRTNYYEIVPAQYLETMLWTHAERMARPVVDKEVFENELMNTSKQEGPGLEPVELSTCPRPRTRLPRRDRLPRSPTQAHDVRDRVRHGQDHRSKQAAHANKKGGTNGPALLSKPVRTPAPRAAAFRTRGTARCRRSPSSPPAPAW